MYKRLFFTTLILLQTSLFAKIEADSIKSIMSEKINTTTSLIQKNKNNPQAIKNQIYAIFDPVFDYVLMAKLSLGKRQYQKLSTAQRDEFTKKFEQRLKKSFVSKLNLYTDEVIKINDVKDFKKRKILETKLIGKDKTYPINYKFYNAKERGWLIYDVNILDISIIQTYKNQFARALNDNDFKHLLSLLDKTEPNIKK